MIKKLSDKDKIDWQNFLSNKEKIIDKEIFIKKNTRQHLTKKIDLHGFSLDSANDMIEKFIKKSYDESVNKIIVITGKGLHSKSSADPYVSKNLSILKEDIELESKKTILEQGFGLADIFLMTCLDWAVFYEFSVFVFGVLGLPQVFFL